jgi:hypothetical protein
MMLFTASTALSVSASSALTSFLVGSGRSGQASSGKRGRELGVDHLWLALSLRRRTFGIEVRTFIGQRPPEVIVQGQTIVEIILPQSEEANAVDRPERFLNGRGRNVDRAGPSAERLQASAAMHVAYCHVRGFDWGGWMRYFACSAAAAREGLRRGW